MMESKRNQQKFKLMTNIEQTTTPTAKNTNLRLRHRFLPTFWCPGDFAAWLLNLRSTPSWCPKWRPGDICHLRSLLWPESPCHSWSSHLQWFLAHAGASRITCWSSTPCLIWAARRLRGQTIWQNNHHHHRRRHHHPPPPHHHHHDIIIIIIRIIILSFSTAQALNRT